MKYLIALGAFLTAVSTSTILAIKPVFFDIAATSGFIWKHDTNFKQIYGQGIQDAITLDACCGVWPYVGFGVQGSYWRARGKTLILRNPTHLHEIPVIGYVRAQVGGRVQGFVSLGGGTIFVKEKSYLGTVRKRTGIGEVELGTNIYFYKNLYLTGVFRYLFPRGTVCYTTTDLGGYGLRAGFGVTF
jgi:hypothetical protein